MDSSAIEEVSISATVGVANVTRGRTPMCEHGIVKSVEILVHICPADTLNGWHSGRRVV